MVRYARAKGSKASNERRVEDATPWQVMRNQMIEAQNKAFQKVDDCVNEVNDKHHEKKVSTIWASIDVPETKSEKKLKKLSSLAEVCQTSVKSKSKRKIEDNYNEDKNSGSWASNDVPDCHPIKKSKTHSFLAEDEFIKPKKKKYMQNETLHKVEDNANEISGSWASNDVSDTHMIKKSKERSFLAEDEYIKPKKKKYMQNETLHKVEDNANESEISLTWPSNDVPDHHTIKKSKTHSFLAEDEYVKPSKKKYLQNETLHKVEDNANENEISASWASNDVSDTHMIKKSKEHSFLAEDEYVKPKKKKHMQNEMLHKDEEPNESEISCSRISNDNDVPNSNIKKKSKKHSFLSEDECVKPKKSKSYNDCKTEIDSSPKLDSDTSKTETNINPEFETETNHKKRKHGHNFSTKPYWEMESDTSKTYNEWHRSENIQYGNEFKNNKLKNKTQKRKRKELNFRERKREYRSVEFIGGRKVEIYYFDGYPVMKEDWEQLVALKEDMLKKGIPEDEMRAALKLERRRAEKALYRQRKKVCFHCRESGHLLSDCPTLNGDDPFSSKKKDMLESANAEICFKCGSTEHTYLKCKLGEKDNFKFASCFICGEQGHISRQCPENPCGMYPKGGACKACGDVTHLRRDCPQYQQEQQQGAVTLPTLEDKAALEDLEVDMGREKISITVKPVKKVVKF